MELERIGEVFWTIKGFKGNARPFIIGSEDVVSSLSKDKTLQQLVNVCNMENVVGDVVLMPDAHEGYGFPIGAIAATPYPEGIVSPGGIGYDINCGVRLLSTPLMANDPAFQKKIALLVREIFNNVPSGVGRGGKFKMSSKQLENYVYKGVPHAIKEGFGLPDDHERIESMGCIKGGDPDRVSGHAKERGRDQLGTMGAGNHFVEVDVVEEVYREDLAKELGLEKGQVTVLIHTGSRGYGHQIATDYIRIFLQNKNKWKLPLIDRELAYAPIYTEEGTSYLKAMITAANFAFVNRQFITHSIREVFKKLFKLQMEEIKIVYDVAHNIAKVEEHVIDGKLLKVLVHRKGATRAFGPSHPELPLQFKKTGQPVLIPGSMGTASYVLCGTDESMKISLGSCCHGAGRNLSRRAAIRQFSAVTLKKQLEEKGITVAAGSNRGLVEEAPEAYKNVDVVVRSVEKAGIAIAVARLKPIGVIKG